jgi:tRNA(fMet)-specific endonuclease VapC
MTWLLDTNVCIEYLRSDRGLSIAGRLATKAPEEIVLCSVVRAELFFGAFRSCDAAANLSMVREFVSRFLSLPFDDAAAEIYGQIRAALSAGGTPIGPNDLLIASIALSRNLTLVTHNVAEFSRVPDLNIEDWEDSVDQASDA